MKTKLYQLVLFLCSCAMLVACESEDDRQTVKDGVEDVIEGYKIPLKIEDRYWGISIYISDKTEDELSSYWKRLQAKLGAQESNTFDYESRLWFYMSKSSVEREYEKTQTAYRKRSEIVLSNLHGNMKKILENPDSLATLDWSAEYVDSYYFEKLVGAPNRISKLGAKVQGKMAEELVACIRDCNWADVEEVKYDWRQRLWTMDCGPDGIWYAKKVKGGFLYGNMLDADKKPVYDSTTYSRQLKLKYLTGSGLF